MKLTLVAYDTSLFEAYSEFCGDLPSVEIVQGSIFDVAADAYVSPANSFGFMDGGIDAQYCKHFGIEIQNRVREAILYEKQGELLIGDAVIVETDTKTTPYLIAAPTMRVPMILGHETINPYLAMRAVIILVRRSLFASGINAGEPVRSYVRSIAIPGLGTGIGQVSAMLCAKQVRQAILLNRDSDHKLPRSWSEASEMHQLLYSDAARDLQR